MEYDFSVEQKDHYLHVKGWGELNAAAVRQLLVDAYQACVERNVGSLLLEMQLTGTNLGMGEVFSVINERSHQGSKLTRIAYVERNTDLPRQFAEFAELVAKNRFVNVRLFDDVADAQQWLEGTQ